MASIEAADAMVVRGQVIGAFPRLDAESESEYRVRVDDIARWLLSTLEFGSPLIHAV